MNDYNKDYHKNGLIDYEGMELGPIRPPSEANSLLLRVTRNCPWNKCGFCGLYKGKKFSIRKKEHVFEDINQIRKYIEIISGVQEYPPEKRQLRLKKIMEGLNDTEYGSFYSAIRWFGSGMKSVFLQDANSMIIKPDDMIDILRYLKACFPTVERITSYARSDAIARISEENLSKIAAAGLNRIHIGMESASNKVLQLVNKGVNKEIHINAGQKVKAAGIELSEYVMPGLGGNEYSKEHALETADALNQINPDFIRIRTFALLDTVPLAKEYQAGNVTRANDTKIVEELLLMLENLSGITSKLVSDHVLNLLPELEGVFPQDQEKMLDTLRRYLDLNEEEKMIFQIGRRTGLMIYLADLANPVTRQKIADINEQYNITAANLDEVIYDIMKGFV